MKRNLQSLLVAMALASQMTFAAPKVSEMFNSKMVLQRDREVPVWGTAGAGEKVTVSFAGQAVSATADGSGKWMVKLRPMTASAEGREMEVSAASGTVTFTDVLVGDVWLCSGQSNMWLPLESWIIQGKSQSDNYYRDSEPGEKPVLGKMIRYIRFNSANLANFPMNLEKTWDSPMAPGYWGKCSGVAYFFARNLVLEFQKDPALKNVPVGLVQAARSGAAIEEFLPASFFPEHPGLLLQMSKDGRKSGVYDTLISHIMPFAIRGAIWYQGCTNWGEEDSYITKFESMVKTYRAKWGYDFPIYWVQLAGYGADHAGPGAEAFPKIRDAQRRLLPVIEKGGMATAFDIGSPSSNLHPPVKKLVGDRLAKWALAKDYGKDIVYSGPLFKEAVREGSRVRVSFDSASTGTGLIAASKDPTLDNPLTNDEPVPQAGNAVDYFELAGADKKWAQASAVIDGKTVVVSAPSVADPRYVRYGYIGAPKTSAPILYNRELLPAIPFREESVTGQGGGTPDPDPDPDPAPGVDPDPETPAPLGPDTGTGPDFSGPLPTANWRVMLPMIYKNGAGRVSYFRYYVTPGVPEGMKVPLVVFLHGAGERYTWDYIKDACLDLVQYSIRRKMPVAIVAPWCSQDYVWVDAHLTRPDWNTGKPWAENVDSQDMKPEPTVPMRALLDVLPILIGDQELPAGHSLEYDTSLPPFKGVNPVTPVPSSFSPLPVDKERIYATGVSMGGCGTWDLISRYPETFAAALPICGGGDTNQAPKLAKMAIRTYHCSADKAVPVRRSQAMVQALRDCNGDIRYQEVPKDLLDPSDTNLHCIWYSIYQDDTVWDWLFSHRKIGGKGFPHKDRW